LRPAALPTITSGDSNDRDDSAADTAHRSVTVPASTPLRQKRRERLKAVSDEALIDLDDYTMMLIAKPTHKNMAISTAH
jgi:hypothetical protein